MLLGVKHGRPASKVHLTAVSRMSRKIQNLDILNPMGPDCLLQVRFEGFTAVSMKNVVFWDIRPSSYFTGDTLRLHYRIQPVNAM
jgi:hypothetical protein